MLKRVGECWPIPRGYAPAWYDVRTSEAVCAPVGLHLVIGWCRQAYIRLWMACVTDAYKRAFDAGFVAGIEHGRRCDEEVLRAKFNEGRRVGREAAFSELESALTRW